MSTKIQSIILRPVTFIFLLWLLAACIAQTGPLVKPAPASGTNNPTVEAVRNRLATWLHVDPQTVEVVSAEAVEWPDGCLGVAGPDEMCAQNQTPGYKITLQANGDTYVLHTEKSGTWVRVAAAPEPKIGQVIIAWEGKSDFGECVQAQIDADGVVFGHCSGKKVNGHFSAETRSKALAEFAAKYATFTADTPAGKITLTGQGAAQATAAEQEQLAKWTQNLVTEAATGHPTTGLHYEGPAEMGSPDTKKCAVLELAPETAAMLGVCGTDQPQNKELGERDAAEWAAMQTRFAPFVYETPTETLVFNGMGSVSGEVWQRALVAWARVKYAELQSGRTSATAHTAMSWHLGQKMDERNTCLHLTVLNYGYAYAEKIACEGLDVLDTKGGWLTTEQMTKFDQWLYQRAALYQDKNYIDGKGTEPVSEPEIAVVQAWATNVWENIAQRGGATQTNTSPANCPALAEGTLLLVKQEQGYCLLYPANYSAISTVPTTTNIVSGTIMNHVEPRISISVDPANGRTLEQVATQMETDYGLPGMKIERGSTTVGGVEAVMFDNLPGQDLNRRVVLIQNGQLYAFFIMPLGEEGTATRTQAERLYQTVLDSFRFLTETVPTPQASSN